MPREFFRSARFFSPAVAFSIFPGTSIARAARCRAVLAFFAFGVLNVTALRAQDMTVPLFVIAKNTNANAVHYDAELTKDGKLDPNQPVVAYWIMAAENGHRQELN